MKRIASLLVCAAALALRIDERTPAEVLQMPSRAGPARAKLSA